MQTVTVEINKKGALKALQDLQEKQLITIVKDEIEDSAALPGKPSNLAEFRAWLKQAEDMPVISLKDAKTQWASKKKLISSPMARRQDSVPNECLDG